MFAPQRPLPQTITITPGAMLRVSGLLGHQIHELKKRLTIPNRRQQVSKRFSGWGAPDEPEFFYGFEEAADDDMLIAPGALEMLCRWLWREYPGVRIVAGEPLAPWPVTDLVHAPAAIGDEEYQTRALLAVQNLKRGIVVGPCGSGKTRMAVRAMVYHNCPWLILVHTKELTQQWVDSIQKLAGIAPSVYTTTRKQRFDPDNPFVIARVQGLRVNLPDVVELARTRAGVLVDEAHHTPSDTFTAVLRYLPATLRYGFTATPDRQDGSTSLMHWYIGPEIARIERSDTEAAGRTLRPKLKVVSTRYADTYDPDEPGDDARLKTRMYADQDRLTQVADVVRVLMVGRRAGIVITDRIPYGYAILEKLTARGVRAAFCHGQLKKSERKAALAAIDAGDVDVLIATSLADEGLDIPHLDTCFLVTPIGNAGRCEQRWGRIARSHPDKLQPLIVDFVDPQVARTTTDPVTGTERVHRLFVNQFRKRLAGAYRNKVDYRDDEMRRLITSWCAKDGARDRYASA